MKQFQRFSKTVLVSAFFTIATVATTATQAKQYYKWVDNKGSTHYTTTPPPKNARSKSKVNTYGYQGSATAVAPHNTQNAPQNTQQNNQQLVPQNNPQTSQTATQPAINQAQNSNHAEPTNQEAR